MRLIPELATIRQLLIFDNVLFVRIILPFASPLSTLAPPISHYRITNLQRNNANSDFGHRDQGLLREDGETNQVVS